MNTNDGRKIPAFLNKRPMATIAIALEKNALQSYIKILDVIE